MATNFDFNTLGLWPDDCNKQGSFMLALQTKLNSLVSVAQAASADTVLLSQTTEPTQGQWETAYAAQTGKSIPIPPSAQLIWFNPTTSEIAGVYGTFTGTSTVYKRGMRYGSGIIHAMATAYDNVARSSNRTLQENSALLPSVTITTYVTTTLNLEFSVSITSGGANAGIDFLLNSTKVGTQYSAVAPYDGIISTLGVGRWTCKYVITDLPAGTYVIRPLFGVVGSVYSGTTIAWGGASNVTRLTAEAVVQ